eukprot:GFKZ01007468.1.p1 GENE.GFKZ01007468.1~~GFKZ01007468.1.p1  ORF type:complete len:375 (-),score=32.54 GFKZ01007468.1:1954-3078(-)
MSTGPHKPIDITGYTADGDLVTTVHLTSPDGMTASILTYGARLLDLRLADGRPLTLSFSSLSEVQEDPAYVGVVVGRTANRIRDGRLLRDNAFPHVKLELNENNRNHIHGGRRGWDKRLFTVRQQSKSSVELFLYSPDGDQGYPSAVEVVVRYELTGDGGIAVELNTTNVGRELTVTNMTLHPYFDLTGRGGRRINSVFDYTVHAPECTHYLALDQYNCPTGKIDSVDGTRFDLRNPRPVAPDNERPFLGYDQYFVASLQSSPEDPIRSLLTISCPPGSYGPGVQMEVLSNQPGFQMYTANGCDGSEPGKFQQYGSIAVEPSGYIDAANHAAFPNITLQPSETRNQVITYKFRTLPNVKASPSLDRRRCRKPRK